MKIFICLIALSFIFSSSTLAYFDSHLHTGSLITLSLDWTPPPTPDLIFPPNDSSLHIDDFYQSWSSVVDDMSPPITYEYQTCEDILCSQILYIQRQSDTTRTSNEVGGLYWRVKAIDSQGNQSPWSSIRHVFVYEAEPTIKLIVKNTTFEKEISEKTKGFNLTYQTSSSWPLPNTDFTLLLNQKPIYYQDPRLVDPNFSFDNQSKTINQKIYFDLSEQTPPFIWESEVGSDASVNLEPLENIVYVPANTFFTFESLDPNLDYFKFKLNSADFQANSSFSLPNSGEYSLEYIGVDKRGFDYPPSRIKIIVDDSAPEAINDLLAINNTVGINLSWLSSGASSYDLRSQSNCQNETDFNWEIATKIPTAPPLIKGQTESIDLNLDSGHYCFAIKAADPAPNWTPISNIATISIP